MRYIVSSLIVLLLTGCAIKDGPPTKDIDVSKIPDAVPQPLPKSRYGNDDYTSINGVHYHILKSAAGYNATGMASWYGTKFDGHLTSTRETYHLSDMTAAHRTLPLPCFVRVTNLSNGRSVVVKVNDRGPFAKNRLIDLSYAAAKKLGFHDNGTGFVRVTAIDSNNISLTNPIADEKSFYLQVAAFRIKENAMAFKEKLSSKTNYPILIEETQMNGNPLYRIQVGPIKDIQESLSLKKDLHLGNLL
jgi:peptidoglycan lytic transglycosylase